MSVPFNIQTKIQRWLRYLAKLNHIWYKTRWLYWPSSKCEEPGLKISIQNSWYLIRISRVIGYMPLYQHHQFKYELFTKYEELIWELSTFVSANKVSTLTVSSFNMNKIFISDLQPIQIYTFVCKQFGLKNWLFM